MFLCFLLVFLVSMYLSTLSPFSFGTRCPFSYLGHIQEVCDIYMRRHWSNKEIYADRHAWRRKPGVYLLMMQGYTYVSWGGWESYETDDARKKHRMVKTVSERQTTTKRAGGVNERECMCVYSVGKRTVSAGGCSPLRPSMPEKLVQKG
jgi:hypothetical protein